MMMRRTQCLSLLLLAVGVFADDDVPVPGWYMHISKDNFGASGAGYTPGRDVWHCGWDILCPEGTPVKAIADGVIVLCSPSGWDDQGRNENYGLVIAHQLSSGQSYYVIYGHLKRLWNENAHRLMSDGEVRTCRINQVVYSGEVIGEIGAYSTPHLHFAVYFNPEDTSDVPTTGLGRQPLPKPEAVDYQGVTSYGNWRNPRQWLSLFGRISASYNNTLPTGSIDGSFVYFLHQDSTGHQTIKRTEIASGDVVNCLEISDGMAVDDIFAGKDEDLYLHTHRGNQYYLLLLHDGKLSQLYEQSYSFSLTRWSPDCEYLPIFRGLEWEILDLDSGEVRDRQTVLGGGKGGGTTWDSIFSAPRSETWTLLGVSLDLSSGMYRPVTWIIDSDTQRKLSVSGFPDTDCRGITVFKQKPLSDDGCYRVMLGGLDANHYRLLVARLRPKENVKDNGYQAEEVRVWSDFPEQSDVIPHDTVQTENGEFGLVSARVDGNWRIYTIDSDGNRSLLPQ